MFAKVFKCIFDSTIAENYKTRHVFIDLLTLADPEGIVNMTVEAISRRTNVPLEIVAEAITELSSPDLGSQSPAEDGRRLVLAYENRDWGWRIVNYEHYRNMRNEEGRREYFRTYQKQRRNKILSITDPEAEKRTQCTHLLTKVEGDPSSSASTSVSPEKEKGVKSKEKKPYSPEFEQFWKAYPRGEGKIEAWNAWQKAQAQEILPSIDELLSIVTARAQTEEWLKNNGSFVPHASTWLNGRRWTDERRNLKFVHATAAQPVHSPSADEELDFNAMLERKKRERLAREKWESTPHAPDETFTFSE